MNQPDRRAPRHSADPDATARTHWLERLAGALAVGVVLLDGDGGVAFANAAARRIFAARDGLEIANRRLRAALPGDQRRLVLALGAVSGGAGAAAVVTVSRPSSLGDYTLRIQTRPDGALVLLADRDAPVELDPALVAALYALTPAEARLACALAAGESPDSYAQRVGVTRSTVRWTLKQVQAKTGARRQADLVRLLLTGPAGVRLL